MDQLDSRKTEKYKLIISNDAADEVIEAFCRLVENKDDPDASKIINDIKKRQSSTIR